MILFYQEKNNVLQDEDKQMRDCWRSGLAILICLRYGHYECFLSSRKKKKQSIAFFTAMYVTGST